MSNASIDKPKKRKMGRPSKQPAIPWEVDMVDSATFRFEMVCLLFTTSPPPPAKSEMKKGKGRNG